MQYLVAESKDHPTPSVMESRQWWDRLLPLLIFLVAVGVVGAYFVPSYPTLAIPIGVLLVGCALAQSYISIRASKALQDPFPVERTSNSSGWPKKRKKMQYKLVSLNMSSSFLMFSGGTLLLSHFRVGYTSSSDLPFAFSVVSLIYVTLFAILWRRNNSPTALERWLDSGAGFVVFMLLSLAFYGLSVWVLAFEFPKWAATGRSSSWSQLYDLAHTQARRIDDSAVLESVSARVMYLAPEPYSSERTPMSVEFDFVGQSSGLINVEVVDTNPPRLKSAYNWEWARQMTKTSEEIAHLKSIEPLQKLAPREIFRLTEQEALQLAEVENLNLRPTMNLFLGCDCNAKYGVPLAWEVWYYSPDFDQQLGFIVDASTGRVLQKTVK